MFVSDMLTEIKHLVEISIAKNVGAIAHAISPVFFAALGVYVCFVAFNIIYSQRDILMNEVSKNIMAWAVISVFTYSGSYYANYVIPFVLNAGNELSAAVLGEPNVATSVDAMWQKMSSSLDMYLDIQMQRTNKFDIGRNILIYITWGLGYIGGAILMYYATVFLCLSTFAIGIVLSVGVIFICFSAFPVTRGMFTSWCGICLNYILLNVFFTISFSFLVSLIEKQTAINPEALGIGKVVLLFLTITVSIYLIEQISVISSSLTGGVGINGLTSAGNSFASGLARASGMRALGRRVSNVAKGFGNKMKNSAKDYAANKLGLAKGTIKGG